MCGWSSTTSTLTAVSLMTRFHLMAKLRMSSMYLRPSSGEATTVFDHFGSVLRRPNSQKPSSIVSAAAAGRRRPFDERKQRQDLSTKDATPGPIETRSPRGAPGLEPLLVVVLQRNFCLARLALDGLRFENNSTFA